jgi:hypothetical protein
MREEYTMLYNLSLHLNGDYVTSALMLTATFILISLLKEKRDERKRA